MGVPCCRVTCKEIQNYTQATKISKDINTLIFDRPIVVGDDLQTMLLVINELGKSQYSSSVFDIPP